MHFFLHPNYDLFPRHTTFDWFFLMAANLLMLKMEFSEQGNVLVEFLVTHMSYIWSFYSVNIEERLEVE